MQKKTRVMVGSRQRKKGVVWGVVGREGGGTLQKNWKFYTGMAGNGMCKKSYRV